MSLHGEYEPSPQSWVRGEERQVWWERAVTAYPPYAEYPDRTGRRIPVLVARPAG